MASTEGALPLPLVVTSRSKKRRRVQAGDDVSLTQRRPIDLSLDLYDMGANYQMMHVFHRRNLTRLLRELLLMHQWEAAAGVVAVLLTAEPGAKERVRNRSCRELKYLPEYRALIELVLCCRDQLALSFNNVVRLYRKILTRLEVKPTGFSAQKDSAPGNGPLQMELAFFLMKQGEFERAYDAVKPLLLSSLHKHVPIFHVYAGLLQQALWLRSVDLDAKRLQTDAQAVSASVRTREHFHLATTHFMTAESLEPDAPLPFQLRQQLEGTADKLGAAAGSEAVAMSHEEMVHKLTALCDKTHDVELYESLSLLLEAASPPDPAAQQRCYSELLKVDPTSATGLRGLQTLHEQGHVPALVYMEARARQLDKCSGDAPTWGELLGCLEQCVSALKRPAAEQPITLRISLDRSSPPPSNKERTLEGDNDGPSSVESPANFESGPSTAGAPGNESKLDESLVQSLADTWLWRMGTWQDRQFQEGDLNGETSLVIPSTSESGREVDGPGEQASLLMCKAAVSAFLFGTENEYTQGVLKLLREVDQKLCKELESHFHNAAFCTEILELERKKRDGRYWERVCKRELASIAKQASEASRSARDETSPSEQPVTEELQVVTAFVGASESINGLNEAQAEEQGIEGLRNPAANDIGDGIRDDKVVVEDGEPEFDEGGFGPLEIADEWLTSFEEKRQQLDVAEFVKKAAREKKQKRESLRKQKLVDSRTLQEDGSGRDLDVEKDDDSSKEKGDDVSSSGDDESNDGASEDKGDDVSSSGDDDVSGGEQETDESNETGIDEESEAAKGVRLTARQRILRKRQDQNKVVNRKAAGAKEGSSEDDVKEASDGEAEKETEAEGHLSKEKGAGSAEPPEKQQTADSNRRAIFVEDLVRGASVLESARKKRKEAAGTSEPPGKRQQRAEGPNVSEETHSDNHEEALVTGEEKSFENDDLACTKCGSVDDGHVMVLCDGEDCHVALHTYCMPRPLKGVPKGDWFCPECRKKPKYAWKRRT